MYCSSMWFDSTVTSMKKLKIADTTASEGYKSGSNIIVLLKCLLRKFVFSFKTRIIESDNSLVNGIVTSTIPLFSSIWARWSDILDIHP